MEKILYGDLAAPAKSMDWNSQFRFAAVRGPHPPRWCWKWSGHGALEPHGGATPLSRQVVWLTADNPHLNSRRTEFETAACAPTSSSATRFHYIRTKYDWHTRRIPRPTTKKKQWFSTHQLTLIALWVVKNNAPEPIKSDGRNAAVVSPDRQLGQQCAVSELMAW